MQELDLSTFSENQIKRLHSDVVRAIEEIFERGGLDEIYQQVDLALNQTFRSSEVKGGLLNKLGSVDGNISEAQAQEEIDNSEDEFSAVYTPLTHRNFKGWVAHLKEALLTGDKFQIKRKYSTLFQQLGLQEFLPIIDNCWEKNIKVEDERFKISQKIRRAISQFVAYGATPGVVFYDHEEAFADVKTIPLRDYGIYPQSDEWFKSINVYRYDVNYSDLIAREDLNQEVLSQLKPWTAWSVEDGSKFVTPTTRSSRYENHQAPYGKMRIHEVWIPSLFLESEEDNEDIVGTGIHLICAYNPQLKKDANQQDLGGHGGLYILKASHDVSYVDFTILFAAFDDTLPGNQMGKGPIIPFLIFQAVQNQLMAGMCRDISREADPPIKVLSAENSIEDTPIPEFRGGAIYEGIDVQALSIAGFENRLLATREVLKYLDEAVETGTGMNKLSLGGRPTSKRTKFELQEQQDSGAIRINDAADLFEEGYLKPMYFARVSQEQHQLSLQVESGVQFLLQLDPTLEQNIQEAYELVLSENKLFQRLLEFMELAPKYEDFYAGYQEKIKENELYEAEFARLIAGIQQIQQQLQEPYAPFADPQDPETYNEASVDVARQEFYLLQEQQRQQLQEQLGELTQQAKVTQGLIENLKEIPEPSNLLYYQLLSHPIKQSDVIVYGAKSTLNKSMIRRATLDLLTTIASLGIPPQNVQDFLMEIDIKEVLKPYMSSIDMPYENVKKSTVEINRIKQQIQAQMEQLQAQEEQQQ